jgi:hypothetical protein
MNPSNSPDPTTRPFGQPGARSEETSTTSSSVAQAARETAAKVKTATSDTISRVAGQAENLADRKKQEAAEHVDTYGSAVHETAKALEDQDPNIAWLTHQAADRLQRVASYVRERDFRGLREDAASLARRHPAAFFGGMCVAGLVLGSVLKASQRSTSNMSTTSEQEREGASSTDFDAMGGEQGSWTGATTAPAAAI